LQKNATAGFQCFVCVMVVLVFSSDYTLEDGGPAGTLRILHASHETTFCNKSVDLTSRRQSGSDLSTETGRHSATLSPCVGSHGSNPLLHGSQQPGCRPPRGGKDGSDYGLAHRPRPFPGPPAFTSLGTFPKGPCRCEAERGWNRSPGHLHSLLTRAGAMSLTTSVPSPGAATPACVNHWQIHRPTLRERQDCPSWTSGEESAVACQATNCARRSPPSGQRIQLLDAPCEAAVCSTVTTQCHDRKRKRVKHAVPQTTTEGSTGRMAERCGVHVSDQSVGRSKIVQSHTEQKRIRDTALDAVVPRLPGPTHTTHTFEPSESRCRNTATYFQREEKSTVVSQHDSNSSHN
jgi:hypothetical protein